MLTFQALTFIKETTEPAGPFGTMPHEPCHPGRSTKPDRVIQFNSGKVWTNPTRKWWSFNNRGTKMLSDELGLIANNSKSFKSIRNNSGLCKSSEIYLI